MAWVVPKVPTYGRKSSGEINLENIFLIGQSNVLQEQKKKNIYIYIYIYLTADGVHITLYPTLVTETTRIRKIQA